MKKGISGFSIPEVLIATALLLVATAMTLNFVVESTKASIQAEGKNMSNYDMRRFTTEMTKNARDASYFRLYNSFASADRNATTDQLMNGNPGDLLVLVYLSELTPGTTGTRPIEKIVGYYRDVANPAKPELAYPVKKFELSFSPASTGALESLLPSESSASSHRVLIENSRGLADKKMFYNFWNKSVMINGAFDYGTDAKKVSESYNFTVTPRG